MNPDELQKQKETILFTQLLLILHSAAMQNLGKIVDPVSGQSEMNLDQAKSAIDTLDMLQHKCAGNLSPDEDRFLSQMVSDLKLNYVDEVNRKNQTAPTT